MKPFDNAHSLAPKTAVNCTHAGVIVTLHSQAAVAMIRGSRCEAKPAVSSQVACSSQA